jgi:DNA-binding response OmpR family regulator
MGRLAGKHILVVEDEYFIATDLERTLRKEEAIIIGPVGNLDAGLSLAGDQPVDAAILDVNLGEVYSYAIADRLKDRAIPYMFLTGYDGWSLPPDYRACPRLPKPFTAHSVVTMMEQLLSTETAER